MIKKYKVVPFTFLIPPKRRAPDVFNVVIIVSFAPVPSFGHFMYLARYRDMRSHKGWFKAALYVHTEGTCSGNV